MPLADYATAARAMLRRTPLHMAWRYATFGIGARRMRGTLDGVTTYCLFLGHARSGHSIVGALLDAHPSVTISDELDALRYLSAGFSRRQLLYGSLVVSRHQGRTQRRKAGRGGSVYSYHVPGQWQGRQRELRVIGDSQAGWTTRRLARDPQLLVDLERRMGSVRLRFIHVVRNPFDNIATMMMRGGRSFESAFSQYASNCDAIPSLAERIGPGRMCRLRHEQLVQLPRDTLAELCRFLGVEPTDDYLAACAGILYRQPSRSREHVEWSGEWIARVRELIVRHEFLGGYSFED